MSELEGETAAAEPEVEETASTAGSGDSGARSRQVISEIGEVADKVIQALGHGVDDAEDTVREGLVQAEKTIREHPLAALGVAAGVGFLVGVLVSRSRE